jgi:hypothetical protein
MSEYLPINSQLIDFLADISITSDKYHFTDIKAPGHNLPDMESFSTCELDFYFGGLQGVCH